MGYHVTLSCSRCGGECEHIADPAPSPIFMRALFRCIDCHRYGMLAVAIQEIRPDVILPQGPPPVETWDQTAPFAGLIHLLMESA